MADTVGRERRVGVAAGDPMAEAPILGVAPGVDVAGKGWIGPRIPGVDVNVVEIDHAAGVDGRCGIAAGDVVGVAGIEAGEEGLRGSGAA